MIEIYIAGENLGLFKLILKVWSQQSGVYSLESLNLKIKIKISNTYFKDSKVLG